MIGNNVYIFILGIFILFKIYHNYNYEYILTKLVKDKIHENINNQSNLNLKIHNSDYNKNYEDERAPFGMVIGSWSVGNNNDYAYECSGIPGSTDC